jgi:glutathione peroxidase
MSIYDFKANLTENSEIELEQYKGKTLIIVNTASACSFTPQYEGLQELYAEYKEQGLEVLAFPCNQFGSQEKGSHEEIKNFCDLKFKTTFPIFSKVEVNGDGAHPLFTHLKSELPGLLGSKKIKWNFTKFLIDKNGNGVKRFAPKDSPKSMIKDIEKIL